MARLLAALLPAAGVVGAFVEGDPPVYVIDTVAGSDLVGDGGLAVCAQIKEARGIVIDARGNLYVADPALHRVRRITPGGIISTVAGTGRPGFTGDGGPADSAQLNRPYGVTVDTAGNLYIGDTYNHRVRRVDANGTIRTVAGNGRKGAVETGDAATTELMAPRNLVFDAAGNLYISEFEGHRVRRVTPDGKITTVAGTGVAGYKGDGGPAVLAQLNAPAGLATDRSGVLYISDSGNRRLRRIVAGVINTVAEMKWSDGVAAVAVDPAGLPVISDLPGLVRTPDNRGGWKTIAGMSNSGSSADGRPPLETTLAPTAIAFDSAGGLYVAELRRVRRILPNVVFTIAGDGTFGFRGDDGPATLAHLYGPTGLALDFAGNLYISDKLNHRIRRVDSAGQITSVAGTGSPGSGANAPALKTALNSPEGLASDAFGNLLIADAGNCRVVRLTPAGNIEAVAGKCASGNGADGDLVNDASLFVPSAVATDPSGPVYISDTEHHRVLKASPDGLVVTYAGNGSKGYAGDGGRANLAQLSSPAGIALDSAGTLFIADRDNNVVRRVSKDGVIDTFAGSGSQSYAGDGAQARQAVLNQPSGVAVDSDGNVYIADTENQRIRKVTRDGSITTIAGNGTQGYDGDGGLATSAKLNLPAYVIAVASGSLYFSDQQNDRVRKLTPQAPVADPIQAITIVNAASMLAGAVAPGEIATIFGSRMGPKEGVGAKLDPSGALARLIGDVEVRFDGRSAPLFWVQDNQINLQVPYGIAGQKQTDVDVLWKGALRARTTVDVVAAAPGLFAVPGDPSRGVVINEDWSVNSTSTPAPKNSIITLFATGEGLTDPPGVEGRPASAPYPKPLARVNLTVGGFEAGILYAGAAPGFCGLMQINARLPGGFLPSGTLPLALTIGTFASQPGVNIVVK